MTIKAIETHYNGYRFRSRLEARWAVFFDALEIEYEYESEGLDLDGVWYLPDFWLPTFNYSGMYCEVKPKGSNFPKASRLAVLSEKRVWLCAGTPDFAIYKILTTTSTEPKQVTVECGCPNAWNAEGENRMFSFPCPGICESWMCQDYQPVRMKEEDFFEHYRNAVHSARSARFERGWQ